MSGEFLPVVLAGSGQPGSVQPFAKAGKYFEVIDDGGGTFDVTFYDDKGAQGSIWRGCRSGLYLKGAYAAFTLSNNSAASQAITLLLMDGNEGGSRRQPGNVAIIDNVPSSVASYTAGMGMAVGFNAVQLLAPASNVNGFILRSFSGYAQSNAIGGSTLNARLVFAPAAPTDSAPGANRLWMADVISVAGSLERFQFPDLKRRIAAGWGCWSVSIVGANAGVQGQHFISGELL